MALSFELVTATNNDRALVEALLREASLPIDGLADQFPSAYVAARSAGELIGIAGLERYGGTGLLRSVAVSSAWRGQGIARALVEDRLRWARLAGVTQVYLLTTTAPAYFQRLGFDLALRSSVPAALGASPEFAGVCPASAVCLSRAP